MGVCGASRDNDAVLVGRRSELAGADREHGRRLVLSALPHYYPADKTVGADDGQVLPAKVGSYPPNAFGLFDVHGNVWEWTADWWAEDYYANSPVDNPQGPPSGDKKVRRGGAWHSAPLFSRISFRNYNKVESRYPNLGFRVVRNAE